MLSNCRRAAMASGAIALIASISFASTLQDSVPQHNSRPGVGYTVYLDPSGFAFDGMWGDDTPGTNLGFENTSPTDTFTPVQQSAAAGITPECLSTSGCDHP